MRLLSEYLRVHGLDFLKKVPHVPSSDPLLILIPCRSSTSRSRRSLPVATMRTLSVIPLPV